MIATSRGSMGPESGTAQVLPTIARSGGVAGADAARWGVPAPLCSRTYVLGVTTVRHGTARLIHGFRAGIVG